MGRVLSVVFAALLVLPACAQAADRGAATKFAAAAVTFERAARASEPADRIAAEQPNLDCHLAQVKRARTLSFPPAQLIDLSLQGLVVARSVVVGPLIAPLATFVAALDRVRTTDPLLRAGRTAWKAQLESLRTYAAVPFPPSLCADITAWVDRGGVGDPFPGIDLGPAMREVKDSAAQDARERRVDRAAERLRALGVARSKAERFTVSRALAAQLSLEGAVVSRYAA